MFEMNRSYKRTTTCGNCGMFTQCKACRAKDKARCAPTAKSLKGASGKAKKIVMATQESLPDEAAE